jgi:hypothetical protein
VDAASILFRSGGLSDGKRVTFSHANREGCGPVQRRIISRGGNWKPSQFFHKTFQQSGYHARERATVEKRDVRTPSGTRTFFVNPTQIAKTSIPTRVFLNKRARESQETFRGASRVGSLAIGSDSAKPTSYQAAPRVLTPGVGRFYAPFRTFSHHSATALDLSNGPKRAAILRPKSAGFPHS